MDSILSGVEIRWPPIMSRPKLLLIVLTLATVPAFARAAEKKLDSNRDIRPILSENCFNATASMKKPAADCDWTLRIGPRKHDDITPIVPASRTKRSLAPHHDG